MEGILRSGQIAGAILAGLLCSSIATPVGAAVAESGWRAATPEEQKLRKVFTDAQDDWNSKRDGEPEMYSCMLYWAGWGTAVRSLDDVVPTISGELTHSYADGQLSHYLTVLLKMAEGNDQAFDQKLGKATQAYATRPDEPLEQVLKTLGKCYVSPTSWDIAPDLRITGPAFLAALGDQTADETAMPEHVVSRDARLIYDQYVIEQDFVAAANYGAQLHGQNQKTTVMWNEVLNSSRFAIDQGRGTELSDALLTTLSQVWWPKWRQELAQNLLRAKHGDTGQSSASAQPYKPETPGWAKQEYERFLRGETNYTPCNVYYDTFC